MWKKTEICVNFKNFYVVIPGIGALGEYNIKKLFIDISEK